MNALESYVSSLSKSISIAGLSYMLCLQEYKKLKTKPPLMNLFI